MTKKLIAYGLIALVAAASAVPARAAVEMNIAAGLNLSRLTGRGTTIPWTNRFGFAGGFFVTLTAGDNFSIQPGFLYSQKGAVLEETIPEGTLQTMMVFSYFDFPLVARLGLPLGEGGSFRIYVLGGASYCLKLKSSVRVDLIRDDFPTGLEDSPAEGFKAGGFAAVAGGGFDFAVKGGRLLLEFRYSRDLKTISSQGQDIRFTALTILFGYSF